MKETFTMRPDVRPASAADVTRVAELIATAFAGLKVVTYLVPDRRERHRVLTAAYHLLVEHALEHGEIHLAEDGRAVAVWLPHAVPPPPIRDYDRRLAEATGEWLERFQALDALFARHRPAEPHHYLAFLAVHPDRQDQGLGSALLRHQHGRLDGGAAYLEASSTGSRDLYARHGYRVREPFALPDGTMYWPMWRPGAA
ncbi:GNAT family N-acetyltransferase [Nonomuraea sp. NPDC050783]|uniref:GNAT family N-acetyltransferase n=1 Tax=Nonomuraea sp. NPDC050783 TaxID=3154634 RepID=UPI003466F87B